MSLNKHSLRLFVMQRHISPITGTAVTAGYKNHECSKSHKMRYSSTVLHDGDQSSLLIQQMSKLTEKQRETRKKFLEAEAVWDSKIMWDSLNQDEIDVVKAHKKAVLSGHFTYDDSKLQKKVMTRLRHFLRGSCCGNACRHCIYNHANVPDNLKDVKVFNSAFWVEANANAQPTELRKDL